VIGFSVFVQFAASLGTTIGVTFVRDFTRAREFQATVIVWLVFSAVTDSAITSILCWYLHKHRTGFSKTDDIITRVVRLTMQTGLIITIWATVDLICYLTLANNIHMFFQLPLCKLYSNSLMSTLNSRGGWGVSFAPGNDGTTSSGGVSGQNSSGVPTVWRRNQPSAQNHTTVQIVTTATVHRDNGIELEEYAVDDTKSGDREDVENPPHAGTAVRLTGALSRAATSDTTSMHSRMSVEAK